MIAGSLIVLAVLAYLGRSLVMLASTGGMAIAIWLAQSGTLGRQFIAVLVGGVGASLAAEGVHLIHHALLGDQPGHGGFWVSAVLVGLIDACAMLPTLFWVRRKQRSAPPSAAAGSDVG